MLREFRRGLHLDVEEFRTRLARTHVLDAVVLDLEDLARLRAFGDDDGDFAINGRNIDLAAEGAIGEG